MQKNAAVILSAGAGKRMHQSMPKQYLSLCGKPVIAWTIEVFQQSPDIDEIVLVTGPDQVMKCREEIVKRYGLTKVSRIVPGGEERGDSVLCGLHALSDDISCVLIHDGARPLVSQEVIVRAAEAAALYGAAAVAVPARETVKIVDEQEMVVSTPDRRTLRMMQTPQAFSYPLILAAYEKVFADGVTVTDDAMAAEHAGVRVKIVEGDVRNIKITVPQDLLLAELLLKDWKRS